MTSPTTITASRGRHAATRTAREPGGRWWWIGGLGVLAGLAYVPLLAVRPGVITPDTKTYLYLDPLRFLSQVPFMWNPTVGLGTVSHEYIGYLLPMGPFYAVFHLLGVPVWVAQRLWLGSILFAAGIGILYLCRILGLRGPGPIAGALLYMLSPYFLQYAGRISVILLPWAGLPFMLGLTIVALRRGGWRQPALFAIVVALVSGINATSIIYVGVVPVLWLLYAVVVLREATWRRALGTAVRIGLLTLGACVWWMAGLEVEAAYGVNVLKYTETVPSTSATSNSADILRGLGYWYFYGTDHLGPWTNAAVRYTQNITLLATSFAVPALAVLGAAFVRWRERAFFLVILFVGVVLAVGPFPYSHPTALGGWLKSFMTNTTAGLALRSTDRATPVVLLALAILLASALTALWRRLNVVGIATAVVIGALVIANNPSLFNGDTIANNFTQPASLPSYQLAAIRHLNNTHPGTRVFAIPGNDFASDRWGDTIDTPQSALLNRDFITREQQIMGSIATADTLYAVDSPIQDGIANMNALAPMARLMGAGDLMVEYDQRYEHYGVPQPQLAGAPAPADPPRALRPEVVRLAPAQCLDRVDAQRAGPVHPGQRVGWPAPLVTYTVKNPRAMLRGESDSGAIVMEGDATGLNNLAGLGLLNTDSAVYYAGTLAKDSSRLHQLATSGAQLVVTDTNRKQAFRWDTLTANAGYTETPSENPAKTDQSDSPVELFPGSTITSKTYASYVGAVNVSASSYGNSVSYTPEDQAYSAIDSNFDTAWIAGTFVPNPAGQWWQAQFQKPVTTDHITVVQPQRGDRSRWVSSVTLTFDGKDPIHYDLTKASHVTSGQTLTFPTRTFHTLRVTLDGTTNNRRHTAVGRRRRILRDRDPGPVGPAGAPDADADAVLAGHRLGEQPRHHGDDARPHLAVPTPQRPRNHHLAHLHLAHGAHLHPLGERQPVRAHPRRRDRPAGGPNTRYGGRSRVGLLHGAPPGRPAGHGVGHDRRQPPDGLATGPGHGGPARRVAHLQPDEADDTEPALHAGHRGRAPLRAHVDDHRLGDPGAPRDPAPHRGQHRAQRHHDRSRELPRPERKPVRGDLHRYPAGVRGQLLLGRSARPPHRHRGDRHPRRPRGADAGDGARQLRVEPAEHRRQADRRRGGRRHRSGAQRRRAAGRAVRPGRQGHHAAGRTPHRADGASGTGRTAPPTRPRAPAGTSTSSSWTRRPGARRDPR